MQRHTIAATTALLAALFIAACSVANGRSDSVSAIDTEMNQKIKDIQVAERPWGVAIR
jgi:YVTN family beta-propeller protein